MSAGAVGVMRWMVRRDEVARFDEIILSDPHRALQSSHFKEILLASLALLKDADPRRFARVRQRLDFVVRTTLRIRGVAQYDHRLWACEIDFLEPSLQYDREFLIGWYACTLVHEATHGEIWSRGILYTPELRSRIERLLHGGAAIRRAPATAPT